MKIFNYLNPINNANNIYSLNFLMKYGYNLIYLIIEILSIVFNVIHINNNNPNNLNTLVKVM